MSYPSRFGKYVLLERVNVGGMAEVFKAKTFGVAGFERILAVKRILPNLVEDDEFVRMFIDEARIAVQLNHANIVQIYELGKHGEHYYIAMEYLASRDLRAILDRLRSNGQLMPIPMAAYVTARVAEGLDFAHKRRDPAGNPMNIVHRDVSPQNVLIGYEGEVKVIDFGIAKAANRASKTQAGVLKGKFGYMSPEQVRGMSIDRRSDIFAVGVLLYEMLTGERLFIGESDFSTLERVRNADVPPPSSFNKKITPALEQVVLRALAREVEDRFQWASELAEALLPFSTEGGATFNGKRLALMMKENYAAEVAAERAKLEEFLRINPDDVKERGAPLPSSVLPLPGRPNGAAPVAASAPRSPPRGSRNQPPPVEAVVDDAPEGEDKTYVIEASRAGMVLAGQATDPGSPPEPADAARRRVNARATVEQDESDDASLYDSREDSGEDAARTMVSSAAVGRPAQARPPPPAPPSSSSPRAPEKSSRAPANRGAPPPPVGMTAAQRASVPQPQAVAAYDPVAAAMAEEEAAIEEALRGTMSDRSAAVAPEPRGAPVDVAQPEAAAVPPSSKPLPMPPPPMPSFDDASSAMAAAPPQDANVALPAHAAPTAFVPSTSQWRIAIAALAVSVAFFFVAVGVVIFRASADVSPPELVLTSAGGAVPPDLTIVLDGQAIATSLPARVPLPAGPHALRVTGTGMRTVERSVVGHGGTVRQPILIVPGPSTPVAPVAGASASAPPASAPPAAVVGGWRLSLAAVGDDGAPVSGAEVLVNGTRYGTTPLEAELDPALDALEVRIVAAGYDAKAVQLARNGRSSVGPATLVLHRNANAAGQAPEPGIAPGPTPPPPDAGAAPPAKAAAAVVTPAAPATPAPPSSDPKGVVAPDPGAGVDRPSATALAQLARVRKCSEACADPIKRDVAALGTDKLLRERGAQVAACSSTCEQAEAAAAASNKSGGQGANNKTQKTSGAAPAKGGVAEIQLGTSPYAETTIDGRKYGSTPFFGPRKLTLSVGKHTVEFIEKQTNKKHKYVLYLNAADPNNKVVIQFNKPDPPRVDGQVRLEKRE